LIALRCSAHPEYDGHRKPDFSCSACAFIRSWRLDREDAAKYLAEDTEGARNLQVATTTWGVD
jgi:hypothetical protein